MNYWYMASPIGILTIQVEEGFLTSLALGMKEGKGEAVETPLIQQIEQQLKEYFLKQRTQFDLPIRMNGTPFQKTVWQTLQTIPYGEVRTYQEIAIQVGNAFACRAIGGANHQNPIPIIVPCHRVVAKNGLGGYGLGTSTKQFLLDLEQHET